jgi:uncharacterized protein YcgI (DUF1989 family)
MRRGAMLCCAPTTDGRYQRLLGGTETVESHLHDNQMTHLNAEIASAGTYMGDISVCLRWLK